MAVTKFRLLCEKGNVKKTANVSLQALTVAALSLPGLTALAHSANENEVSFQYSHYREGKRDLFDVKSQLNPIEVDTLQGMAKIKLSDRIKFAFNYTQDTWSGATPITTAPLSRSGNHAIGADISAGASPYLQSTKAVFDRHFNPLLLSDPNDVTSKIIGKDTHLVHTLAAASPETRKQGDFKLGYEWDTAEIGIGGGISIEKDYESRFGNIDGRWDFNQKLTSVNLGVSYTNSNAHALMDHDAYDYFAFDNVFPLEKNAQSQNGQTFIAGNRQDWATHLGLIQILNKNALVNLNVSYTHSSGFMNNPYKAVTVMFVDPNSHLRTDGNLNGYYASLHEKRPEERNEWTSSLNYVHHIDALDAALHVDYRFFHDDWGINAHTFELAWSQSILNGWVLTPKLRYYSQSAADFYQPVFLAKQGMPGAAVLGADGLAMIDKQGNIVRYKDSITARVLPHYYSSDHRLSGYGTLSGGVTLNKQFARGLSVQLGFEYYTHAGSLKLGGGGENRYADFNYYMANAAVSVDLTKFATAKSNGHQHHDVHSAHMIQTPAGVMFDHSLHNAGDLMVGYRYMYADQAGAVLHGETPVSDLSIVNHGCQGNQCSMVPTYMTMHMHMLDLMYAPTDWLTLMLMPQFVDMNMSMRQLEGAPESGHIHAGSHTTGGVGDTGLYAITKLLNKDTQHVNLSLGFTAPTGDVGVKLRDVMGQDNVLIHYGMQLGSGTWDFKPSLTYTGELDQWSWGVQLTGTKRLESKNASGFAFGDLFQSSFWGGYRLTPWLSTSIRGIYTVQGALKHEFNNAHPIDGPNDFPASYGGRYWDLGLGLSATVPGGALQGNRFSVEWLQPLHDDVNGYQVERDGALSAIWNYMF